MRKVSPRTFGDEMLQTQGVLEASWESKWMKSLGELCLTFSSESAISLWVMSSGQRTDEVICDTRDQRCIKYTKKGLSGGSSPRQNSEAMVKPYEHGDQCSKRRANDFNHPSRSWLNLTYSSVCSRVTTAGLVPSWQGLLALESQLLRGLMWEDCWSRSA